VKRAVTKLGSRAVPAVVFAAAVCAVVTGCGGGGRPHRSTPASLKPQPESAQAEQFVLKIAALRAGMRAAKVRKALGKPGSTESGLVGGRPVECWHYSQGGTRRGTRVCFRSGRLVSAWALVDGRTEKEVRLLLGRPDSTETSRVKGTNAACWRYDYGVSKTRVCFRGGREFFKQTLR
jgi:outer membrane protein assembly factor BamE (lipoprotein component of BamABCDE complex)